MISLAKDRTFFRSNPRAGKDMLTTPPLNWNDLGFAPPPAFPPPPQ